MAKSGYQFVHLEAFARKADACGRSVDFILAEAERRPDACAHVGEPAPPELVFGLPLQDLRILHDVRAEAARATIAGGKTRRIRQDQITLLAVVASHPFTLADIQQNPAIATDVAIWEERVVRWLRETWGDNLVSVVRHIDEAHAHVHAYVLPSDGEMRGRRLHPGFVAKENAKISATSNGADAKTANRLGDEAYCAEMRAMQDQFWRSVGIPCGLARLGPARRRLSRAEWHTEKAGVAAAAVALQVAEIARAEADTARQDAAVVNGVAEAQMAAAQSLQARADHAVKRARTAIQVARKQAVDAKAAADAAEAERAEAERHARLLAARGRRLIDQARGEARRILGSARAEAERMRRGARGLGAWLGALVHGLRGAAPAKVAREAAAAARAEEKALSAGRAALLRKDSERPERELRQAETRLAAVSEAAASLGTERDRLARELDRLRPTQATDNALKPILANRRTT